MMLSYEWMLRVMKPCLADKWHLSQPSVLQMILYVQLLFQSDTGSSATVHDLGEK